VPEKIVFINQDSGYLTIDIINAHINAGYQCVLFTGRLIERNNRLHPDVKIEKVIPYKRNKSISRIFTWVWAFIQIAFRVKLKYRKSELFIISNPPLAPILPLFVKNPFSLLIWDIYPDALIEGKIVSASSIISRWWKNANKKIYPRAKHIFTLTQSMSTVLEQYTGSKLPEIIPVWSDGSFLKPIEKQNNPFISKHNLAGKFIVMYSGNLGFTHHIETLADIAAATKNPDIVFVIIGEGDSKTMLEARIKKYGLSNCLMLPWQIPSELPFSLSAADLAIVSSGGGVANLSIPSKTYNFLSVGVPLLCLSQKGSELGNLVEKHQNGHNFSHEQLENIVTFINEIATKSEYRKTLGDNSLKASKEYSSENAKLFLQ
jgi:hypothetical protein